MQIRPNRSVDPMSNAARHLPGEEGIWIFVLGDLIVFETFFAVYLFYRADQAAIFAAAQETLNLHLGVINTLLMLTSSWFVVMGVDAVRGGQCRRARNLFVLAALCGISFVGVKAVEYGEKFSSGITVLSNDFFTFYFMYTGIHLVHVLFGLVVIFILIGKTKTSSPGGIRIFESGATFWHMVDIVWVILFPLLYLVK